MPIKSLADENMSGNDEARIVVLGSFMTDVIRYYAAFSVHY